MRGPDDAEAGRGEVHTTLDLTVKYLRPATEDSGLLRCETTVINRGRRTALAQTQVVTRQAVSSPTPPRAT
ncbi:hotdog domain-containing protein [Nocardia sp. NBC_00881]|uniref:hotdog domain-containing protein n=1 Tax=Nocardia sp. NBC_00881 TaxID=2975995 RepID=UPI00386B69A1